ncbi:hypothetical protein BDZ89DRAFT_1128305 [Hymenopellis radicata]|nr:hypothetical protein BDZ89DRAFT_1128305 [Hymenopellis radicata]
MPRNWICLTLTKPQATFTSPLDVSRLDVHFRLLLLARSGHQLIILIHNFNWPLLTSTPKNYIDISAFIWDCIIDPFRSALDGGYVVDGAISILGRPFDEEPTWVRSSPISQSLFDHIGCHISDEERVRGAFGFTLPEVQALAAEVFGESDIRIVDELKDTPSIPWQILLNDSGNLWRNQTKNWSVEGQGRYRLVIVLSTESGWQA